MAISPFRVGIMRGARAMAGGVDNPFGKPQLGAADTTKRKATTGKLTPRGVDRGKSSSDKVQDFKKTFDKNRGFKAIVPKVNVGGPDVKQAYEGSTDSKKSGTQAAGVGTKKYGLSGRGAPNIGPTSADGQKGYAKRTRVAAAKAAANNIRLKKQGG